MVFHGPRDRPRIALTIDDGPDPATTPLVLDALDRLELHATFFLIGAHAAPVPELVREIRRRGHEVGHHMWLDRATARLDSVELEAAIERTTAALAPAGPLRWLRPGMGVPTEALVHAATRRGLRVVVGDALPLDTHLPWPRGVAAYLALVAQSGSILTVHDCGARGARLPALLHRLVPALQRRGFAVGSLAALVGASSEATAATRRA